MSSSIDELFSSDLDRIVGPGLGSEAGADDGPPMSACAACEGEPEPNIDESDDMLPANAEVAAASTEDRGGAAGTLAPSPLTGVEADIVSCPVMRLSG